MWAKLSFPTDASLVIWVASEGFSLEYKPPVGHKGLAGILHTHGSFAFLKSYVVADGRLNIFSTATKVANYFIGLWVRPRHTSCVILSP